MGQEVAGAWAAMFGGRRAFVEEAARAVEIEALFECDHGGRRSVWVEHIPGACEPLWGSDGSWLYLRRPEGVWKARVPEGFVGGSPVWLYQKGRGAAGASMRLGGLLMGESLLGRSGWIQGGKPSRLVEAADLDGQGRSELAKGLGVDEAAAPWRELGEEDGKALAAGGSRFDAPPSWSLRGGWLVASGPGGSAAYPLAEHPRLREALDQGRLWARFRGKWFEGFDARVEL